MEFTTTGLSVDSQADIFNAMASDASVSLAPYLNGTTLRTDESSVIGRMLRILARPMAQNNEILPAIISQFDLNQVEGEGLDRLAWLTKRARRKNVSLATGGLVVYGDSGVIIPSATQVQNTVTGDIFETKDGLQFDLNGVCGVTFSVTELKDSYTITNSIDELPSQYPTIIVKKGSETTLSDMSQRIVNSVNSQSNIIKATLNNDETITLLLKEPYFYSDFGLSDGLQLKQSYKLVTITALNYSSVRAEIKTITTKITPILGWRGLYNPNVINESTSIENDADFRTRLKNYTNTSFGSWDSIYSRIYAVNGVNYVNIKENSSSNEVGGVSNNGLAISVQGGDEDEIALAISDSVSSGIATVGEINKVVKDINGGEHDIQFSRPQISKLYLKMQINQYKNFPNNGKQLIKQALVEYFNTLQVGESVQFSRLYTPINTVVGFSISNLQIGLDIDDLRESNIFMSYNQQASLSADNILIGGS
nr:MAG: hypothetical protein [Bacteriophage sp.]